jgi:hypothetical protein
LSCEVTAFEVNNQITQAIVENWRYTFEWFTKKYSAAPEQLGIFISDEMKKWVAIAKASNVTSDFR